VSVSVGGENTLAESLKASVIKIPLVLSVIRFDCQIPLGGVDKNAELVAELK
jgi:hypothetical protein